MEKIRGSRYAATFAFLLRCRSCGSVIREIGGDAYTAERALQAVRASGEVCPCCCGRDWDKLRRIEAEEPAEEAESARIFEEEKE